MSLGSIYESCGLDDIAMSCYMRAMEIKLGFEYHPDLAFPFCGLGSVMYHIDEPAWSLRCYMKAREIRERTLGGDTVDTATVYNNLGCNMFMLERNEESKAYFQLSNAILDAELGPNHERTITAQRNIGRADRSVFDIRRPEYKPLWKTAVLLPLPKKKSKGKKGGKGGGKKKK